MRKNWLSIFFLMITGAYFVMFFPQVVTHAYDAVFQSDKVFARHTAIGTVSVEGLSGKEAERKVQHSVEKWKTSQAYTLTFADQSLQIPLDTFTFLVSESVSGAEDGLENTLYVNMDEDYLTSILKKLVGSDFVKHVNQQALKAELEKQVGLFAKAQTISVTHFLRGEARNQQVLSKDKMVIGETDLLTQWVNEHPTITIPAQNKFSFIKGFVGQNTVFSNEFLSKVSSILYETSLATNLQFVERSISTELPEGYKLGFEAKVNTTDLDFTVYNPNDYDMTVQFYIKDGHILVAEIKGFMTGKSYKVIEREKETYPFKQIVHYTQKPDRVQATKGKEGSSVKIYRDIYDDATGKKVKSIFMAKDFYLPINEVVVKQPVSEATITETQGTTTTIVPLDSTAASLEAGTSATTQNNKAKK